MWGKNARAEDKWKDSESLRENPKDGKRAQGNKKVDRIASLNARKA